MPAAAIVGTLVAYYYYRDEKTRTLAEEVASELGKVSWPSRDEVVNSTFVVIVTTFVATIFFALMNRFWASSPTWFTELERVCRPSQKKRPSTA